MMSKAETDTGHKARGMQAAGTITTEYAALPASPRRQHSFASHGSKYKVLYSSGTELPDVYRRQYACANWPVYDAEHEDRNGRVWKRPPRRGDPMTILELIQSFGDGSDFAEAVREGLEITRGLPRREPR